MKNNDTQLELLLPTFVLLGEMTKNAVRTAPVKSDDTKSPAATAMTAIDAKKSDY